MKRFAASAIALSLLGASVAMANDHRQERHDPRHWTQPHEDRRGHDDGDRSNRRRHDYDHRAFHREGSYERFRAPVYRRPFGYRDYRWSRGERLPRAYYARPYWVSDYRSYRLRPPPRGYYWVRVDNDVLLTALATGVVLDVMYDYFW